MPKRCIAILVTMPLFVLLFASSAHAIWWMGYHKPAFTGRVIDAETIEPIEGAVVVAVYSKTSIGIAHSTSIDIKVKETLTGKDGEFYIPSYTTVIDPLSWEEWVTFIIYKPGYGSFPRHQKVPSGISPADHETFFSKEMTGTEGKLELSRKGEKGRFLKKITVTSGLVELSRVEGKRKRLRMVPSRPTGFGSKYLPRLYKTIDDERKLFGIK